MKRLAHWSSKELLAIAFVVSFGLVGVVMVLLSLAAPKASGVTLTLTPSSQRVSARSTLTLSVWEDSLDKPVNAVQADLTYPAGAFDFVQIDSTGSAFDIEAPSTGGNGTISMARGRTTSITGRQLVATVVLKPKLSSGRAEVAFAASSSLLSASTNQNILQQTSGGRYSFAP